MLAKQTESQNWPFLDNVIGPIADWWRKHAAARDSAHSLEGLGADELARVAQDVGIPASDLRRLAQHCSDAADLLAAREWPTLYDAEVLGSLDVPCAAAIYTKDAYVDRVFSEQTAALIPTMRPWLDEEHLHNGLRVDGARVLDRLLGLVRR